MRSPSLDVPCGEGLTRWLAVVLVASALGGCAGSNAAAPTTSAPMLGREHSETIGSASQRTTTTLAPAADDLAVVLLQRIDAANEGLRLGRSTSAGPTCEAEIDPHLVGLDLIGDEDQLIMGCVERVESQLQLRVRNNRAAAEVVTFPDAWSAPPPTTFSRSLGPLGEAEVQAYSDGDQGGRFGRDARIVGPGEDLVLLLPAVDPTGSAVPQLTDLTWRASVAATAHEILDRTVAGDPDILDATLGDPSDSIGSPLDLIEAIKCIERQEGVGPATSDPWDGYRSDSAAVDAAALSCAWSAMETWLAQQPPAVRERVPAHAEAAVQFVVGIIWSRAEDELVGDATRSNWYVQNTSQSEIDVVRAFGAAPTWWEIRNAEIPSLCGKSPTVLRDGVHVAVPRGLGGLRLRRSLYTRRAAIVPGLPSDAGPLTAVVTECTAGGVPWPFTITFFAAGGRYYGSTDLQEADWASIGTFGPGRAAISDMRIVDGLLEVHLALYRDGEAGCCATGAGIAYLSANDGTIVVERVEDDADQ